MFRNPFSFDGRVRRLEYGLSYILYFVVNMIFQILLQDLVLINDEGTAILIMMIFFIPMIWFMLAQGAKRCHDLDKSGWWQIIPFFALVMLFQDGHGGSNRYGRNPKGLRGPGDELLDDGSGTLDRQFINQTASKDGN